MMSGEPFPWPPPPGEAGRPHWNGASFELGARTSRVLAYTVGESHWNEDLTSLHEAEAGRFHPIDVASRRFAVESMKSLSGPHPTILDVGCSSGFVLDDLLRACPQARLIGADYLRGPLETLARRLPSVPILQFDLRQCPLPANCVDGITCLNVLEHIDADALALGEIHRVLRPGGIAHLEVPAGPELYDMYDEHLMHHRRYRLPDLVAMARAAGFEVRRATHLGFLIYPVFRYSKRRNQRRARLRPEDKARLVAEQIRNTRRSPGLGLLMAAEAVLGRAFSFSAGVRCVVVLRKPSP